MLEGTLGEEVFRIGVSTYLKHFEFNNAETDDLWAELHEATKKTIDIKNVRKKLEIEYYFYFLLIINHFNTNYYKLPTN